MEEKIKLSEVPKSGVIVEETHGYEKIGRTEPDQSF